MVKISQHSWLGGQLDVEMSGRQDIERYAKGASVICNFLPVKSGGLRKRPGTDFIMDITSLVGSASGKFRIVPFAYLEDSGYVLLLKDKGAYAISGSGSIEVTGTIPYTEDELDEVGYCQCGDIMYLAHVNHPPAEIRHTADNKFVYQACVMNTASLAKPEIYNAEIKRNYLAYDYRGGETTDLYAASLVFENGGEEFEGPLYEMESDDEWQSKTSSSEKYLGKATAEGTASSCFRSSHYDGDASGDVKLYAHTVKFSGTSYYLPFTESQRITLSIRFTSPKYNVKQIRLYKNVGGVYGLVAVKRKTFNKSSSQNTVTIEDTGVTPDTSASPMENKTVFDSDGNYPGTVALCQQRLVWAGSKKDPARVWMSTTGDFYEHRPHVIQEADDPIDFILPITQFAKINHILELGKLFAFCTSSEYIIGSNSDVAGLSYETINATAHSHIGCRKNLPPVVTNNSILYCERTGQSIRDYSYDINKMMYGGTDISVFSSSIFNDKTIVDWTWQQYPNTTLWAVLSDGTLASMCYMPDQKICAWATHRLKGGFVRAIAKTCAIKSTEGEYGDTSEIMLVVKRGNSLCLESMRQWCARDGGSVEECVALDSARELSNGGSIPSGMVAIDKKTGAVVTSVGANGAVAGYRIESKMTTMNPPISDNTVGAAQFDVKNVQSVSLRLACSVGGKVRTEGAPESSACSLTTYNPELAAHVTNGDVTLSKSDVRAVMSGMNTRDGRVTVEHNEPWPFEIISMETDIAIEIEGAER